MISAVMPEQAISGTINLTDYRHRAAMGERTMLPGSTPTAPKSSSASDNGTFPQRQQQAEAPPEPEQDHYGAASMFAAAVIAGAMPPAPTTIEEVIMRIGSIPLPPETEARLKDLLA